MNRQIGHIGKHPMRSAKHDSAGTKRVCVVRHFDTVHADTGRSAATWLKLAASQVVAARQLVPLIFAIVALASLCPADGRSTVDGLRYFETHVRPLLAAHCYKCHGNKNQESSLRLDTFSGLMTGGQSGTATVVPGRPASSLLLTAVRYQNPDLQMPPDGRLDDRDIVKLARWIEAGAAHPDADDSRVATPRADNAVGTRRLWSFEIPIRPTLPDVADRTWPQAPLDRFILARLEKDDVRPAPHADRQTLLRRTTMTLIGLPPSLDDVDAFLFDDAPDGLVRVLDRLLGSPHYGERWGRHWLDVARYADSNGLDENVHHGNAWRYRDYVVRSFNTDKPFDEFVVEQLAGDLLPAADNRQLRYERLIATGFLAVGPKVLAEVDETKMEMDIIDEQLDTLGRSIMGLTLGCARCHNHKFDPISTEDYYGLAGIFKSTRVMENYTKVARWWEHPIPSLTDRARLTAHRNRVHHARSALDWRVTRANQQVAASQPSGAPTPKDLESGYSAATKAEVKKLREALANLENNPPATASAMGVCDRDVTDLRVHVRGSHLTLGRIVPRRFPVILAGTEQPKFSTDSSGRLRLARWLTSDSHPLTSRVIVNRIWRWHFGQGLVTTPDNFGASSGDPLRQPLLDWLAIRCREDGWLIKRLHRLSSSTWQLSSRPNAHAARIDPQNRLQSRAMVRRLEVEAIRDSILATAGLLNRSMGGALLTLPNRSFLFDHTSRDATDYNTLRRSIYLPVVRNHLYEVFSLFDYSDAGSVVGDRTASTVAPQALFMMNSDFIRRASKALASRVGNETPDQQRIRRLYRLVLNREPSDDEWQQSLRFLRPPLSASNMNDIDPWPLLCQVLLTSNEFVYLW